MPNRAPKPCRKDKCPHLTSGRYCLIHQADEDSGGYAKREPASRRGYGQAWGKLSRRILMEEPICRMCQVRPSKQVDHIVSHSRGGTDERRNLQGVCWSCHSQKTAAQDGGFGNRARVALVMRDGPSNV